MSETTALYRLYDAAGTLLYVGISLSVFQRMSQHSRERSWWPEVATIKVERLVDRDSALRAERRAIVVERPRYNVAGRPPMPPPFRRKVRRAPRAWVYLSLTVILAANLVASYAVAVGAPPSAAWAGAEAGAGGVAIIGNFAIFAAYGIMWIRERVHYRHLGVMAGESR